MNGRKYSNPIVGRRKGRGMKRNAKRTQNT